MANTSKTLQVNNSAAEKKTINSRRGRTGPSRTRSSRGGRWRKTAGEERPFRGLAAKEEDY